MDITLSRHILFSLWAVMSMGYFVKSANILAIIPITAKSHFIVMEPLLQALASRGHQVTVYSSFPQQTPLSNYSDVSCFKGRVMYQNNQDYKKLKATTNKFKLLFEMFSSTVKDCRLVFETLDIDKILKQQFDLVITEMFLDDCYVHFAHKLRVPLVSIVTFPPMPWIPDKFGLPDNPSYIPNTVSRFLPTMSLYQRTHNAVYITYAKIVHYFFGELRYHWLAEEYFAEELPWIGDVTGNASLLLVNSHPSVSFSRPLPPNVVEIGGIHIKKEQPLDPDLQEILDKSTQGVILFNLGSIVRMATIPKNILDTLLNVFSKIPQTVLMKFEEHRLPSAPKNVITRNWFPQRDILAHKNVVAFISHCGLAGVMEAVYCSKPVIGFPIFGDQHININLLASKGAAIYLDLDSITEQELEKAINEVVNNTSYRKSISHLSKQFRDLSQPALETAVYWTEYVMRHQGAPHLRPASTSLPFYQLHLLDVAAVLLAAMAVITYLIFRLTKAIITLIMRFIKNEKNDSIDKKYL